MTFERLEPLNPVESPLTLQMKAEFQNRRKDFCLIACDFATSPSASNFNRLIQSAYRLQEARNQVTQSQEADYAQAARTIVTDSQQRQLRPTRFRFDRPIKTRRRLGKCFNP